MEMDGELAIRGGRRFPLERVCIDFIGWSFQCTTGFRDNPVVAVYLGSKVSTNYQTDGTVPCGVHQNKHLSSHDSTSTRCLQ